MKNTLRILTAACISVFVSQNTDAQTAFENKSSRLANQNIHSGCPVTVADFDGNGLDDIIRLDQGHDCWVELQVTNGQYVSRHLGDFVGLGAWAMAVADVDHNGYLDIAGGDYGQITILMTNSTGTGGTFVTLPNSNFFVQNMTFADFNNDGSIDLFACDDNAAAHMYLNDGTGNMFESFLINFALNPTIFYGSDPADSGNYGSSWIDFDNDKDLDLYVPHCRQASNDTNDLRRINRLFVNDGNNNYTEMADAFGLGIKWQTWTSSFGDIDNDGDLDVLLTNHDHESMIMENDGTGHYTDITASTGFDLTDITPIESVMEDFDNDGFIDILAAGSDARLWHNNGNKTFSRVNGLFNNDNMESFAIGDLDHDGFIDIYASYAAIYTNPTNVNDAVWINKGNPNNFLTLDLRGTTSNHNAIGARATIYGSWGIQIREVRAGESYGTNNTGMLHFGLGQSAIIDSVVIDWPSGNTQTIVNPTANQFITVKEGDCISPDVVVSSSGPLVLCSGSAITLTAPSGYDYLWSDGTTFQTLFVFQTGEYNCQISTPGNNCIAYSRTYKVIQNPVQTPTIDVSGELEFCDGQNVILSGPNANTGIQWYAWNTGDSTQTISVNISGTYTLTVMGYCQTFSSTPVTVTVHPVALPPVSNNVNLPGPGSATLTATGNNDSWYDVPVGGNAIATGTSFNTPVLNTTTTYYVEDANLFGGGMFNTGVMYNYLPNPWSANTTNGIEYIDVFEKCVIKSAKVYTDVAGDRRFWIKNSSNQIIDSITVYVQPDSQIVNLNFELLPGTGYQLTTDDTYNQVLSGNVSPRLKRSNSGVNYPYTISNLLSVTNSQAGSQYYYYFYDMQVEKTPLACSSVRTPVTVFITTGISDLAQHGIAVYPNPAADYLNINFNNASEVRVKLFDAMSRIVADEQFNALTNTLNTSALTPGIYQLLIEKDGKQYISKLMIK